MDWQQFTMNLSNLEADRVEQVFYRHGAQAITFRDAADNPVLEPGPGETPLWSDTRITGLFAAGVDLPALRQDLKDCFEIDNLPPNSTETLAERAWEREWLKDFRPLAFGRRLWVSPHGMTVEGEDAIIVWLDPGLAFGTGTHETTALCLEWLDSLALEGKRVLDVGCGSGILSIAAVKLGATVAHGIDIDQQAIVASRQNAIDNDVSEKTLFSTDADRFTGEYDVVIANILATTLIDMSADLVARTVHGGYIALSGILQNQVEDVRTAFRQHVRLQPAVVRNGWARLDGIKPDGKR